MGSGSSNRHRRCEEALQKFVLSREDWSVSTITGNTLVYKDKYQVQISILYAGSSSMLMIMTASNVAKAEVFGKYIIKSEEEEERLILTIDELVKKQDWLITFPRKKIRKP